MGFFIRTIGVDRAQPKIGMVNLACDMRQRIWLTVSEAPA